MTIARMLLLSLVIVAGGCSDSTAGSNVQASLNSARAAWNSSGVTTYSFTMLRSCLCTGGAQIARVEVVNGNIVSLTDVPTGTPVSAPSDTLFRTFNGLFDLVQDIIRADPDALSLTWQSQIGHPVQILADFKFQSVDDDLNVQISDVVLPGS